MAERCKFSAYIIYSVALTSFIYPVVVHQAWSADGWLSPWRDSRLLGGCGVIDFAGSGVVHLTGGVAALVTASIVGPRTGRFDGTTKMMQQSMVFQTLGVLILWVGWYVSFNRAWVLIV